MAVNKLDFALFNTAIDSKLRGWNLVVVKVRDVVAAGHVKDRGAVTQNNTGISGRLEITELTRQFLKRWIALKRQDRISLAKPVTCEPASFSQAIRQDHAK